MGDGDLEKSKARENHLTVISLDITIESFIIYEGQMSDIILSNEQKDVLKEIGNICAGNAATSLSQLLDKKVSMIVPQIYFLPIEKVPDTVGGADQLVVGLLLRVLGDMPSTILILFSQKDAVTLTSMVTKKTVSEVNIISNLERSALKEIGVVIAGSYLGVLSGFVGMGLVPTVPELITDMAGAIIDYILIGLSCKSQFALLIDSEFKEVSASVTGHFFLIPDPTALEVILKITQTKL